MKTLKFRKVLSDMILRGEKTSTWRIADDKDLRVGDRFAMLVAESGDSFAEAEIVSIHEKALGSIDERDMRGHETYVSREDMLQTYQKYYGESVAWNTLIKCIDFRLLKPEVTSLSKERWFEEAAKVARQALCQRDRCGSVIVAGGRIIGEGYNAPPQDNRDNAQCGSIYPPVGQKPKSDRTCCMHAEWRAILDALRRSPDKIAGSTLYFCRVDAISGQRLFSGEPYCTVCSRLALDVGISFFALWHEGGIQLYPTKEYNQQSYAFHQSTTIPKK